MKIIKWIVLALLISPISFGATYYIAPAGNDAGDGSIGSPWKTFNKSTDSISSGDTLILKNGTYTHADNGGIDSTTGGGADCDLPPSGTPGHYTIIRGETAGSVFVEHTLQLGSATESIDWVEIYDITFKSTTAAEGRWGGINIYNGDNNYIHDCGFYKATLSTGSVLTVGTSDIENSAQYNIIEDCWVWGSERLGAINYNTSNNVFRRIVIITDGANYSAGNAGVGISIYCSQNVIVENVIVLDRLLGDAEAGSDFAQAQHDPDQKNLNNKWYGVISINAPGNGANFEADAFDSGDSHSWEVHNSAFWNPASGRYAFNAQGGYNDTVHDVWLDHITAGSTEGGTAGIRVSSTEIVGVEIENSLVEDTSGRNYFISATGTINVHHNQGYLSGTTPFINNEGIGDNNSYPVDSQMLYLLTPGTGAETGDDTKKKGAEMLYRYGIDGTKFGDDGADSLTATPLWPWPNEARIKTEICNEVSRSFCTYEGLDGTHDTLTAYVWEILGNEIPADIYGDPPAEDTTDPEMAFNNATDPEIITSGYKVTVTGTSSDTNGIDECKYRKDAAPDATHGTVCTGTTSWSCADIPLTQGDNTYYFECFDPSGNGGGVHKVYNAPSYRAQAGGSFNIR
jgi:hypothetical protein